jgi:hypothetical protein
MRLSVCAVPSPRPRPTISMWVLNPLPEPKKGSFSPPCEGNDNRTNATDPKWSWGNGSATAWDDSSALCEGTFPFGVNVIHELEVPHVPSGEYVLGFRYDSENTAQVWQQVRGCDEMHARALDTTDHSLTCAMACSARTSPSPTKTLFRIRERL